MKIFVSIVSYRDPLLKTTIEDLFERKSNRHDIVVGVFEQTQQEDCLTPEFIKQYNLRYKRIDPEHSDGVGWARHINSLQFDDEDLYYQIDSHMLFDYNWDRRLVNDWKKACEKAGTEKVIITANCKNFDLNEEGVPVRQLEEQQITCKVKYFYYQKQLNTFAAHGDWIPPTQEPEPAIHICAGNFCAPKRWLKEVGIHPGMYFEGEEHVMVLTSFAAGYKIYHPRSIHIYHYVGSNDYVTKQWKNPVISQEVLSNRISKSMRQLRDFFNDIDEEVLERYYEYSGVDYINGIIDERARTYSIKVPEE